jgi:hypothetical protein
MADETTLFWQKKLVENQQILEAIDSGQFTKSDHEQIDEDTLAEARSWAVCRIAECESRISERDTI